MDETTLQFGILGAARIAPFALIRQLRQVDGARVLAVAEEYQDEAALEQYAKKHGIPRTYRSFDALLEDPDIHAVYIPLPISLHAQWVIRAIQAGKHVLCEKPMCANAMEAQVVHDVAVASDCVVAEAMHLRYHPLVGRVKEIIDSGELGALKKIESNFSCYLPFNDFRFNYALGGGGMMDMGCYPISFIRAVTGIEPKVVDAQAGVYNNHIDRWMRSHLDFGKGCKGEFFVGMRTLRSLLSVSMEIIGEKGRLSLNNFIKPEIHHRLVVNTDRMKRREKVYGGSTYQTQLEAFIAAVRGEGEIPTSTEEALHNQKVIDAIYQKAGLPLRGQISDSLLAQQQ